MRRCDFLPLRRNETMFRHDRKKFAHVETTASGRLKKVASMEAESRRFAATRPSSVASLPSGAPSALRQLVPQELISIRCIFRSGDRPSITLTEGRAAFGRHFNGSQEAPGNSAARVGTHRRRVYVGHRHSHGEPWNYSNAEATTFRKIKAILFFSFFG